MLPEFLIEDITEFLSFVSKCVAALVRLSPSRCRRRRQVADVLHGHARRYAPSVLETSSQDELMSFMLVFLSTPYMKNPYLKGQFVEVRLSLSRRARASRGARPGSKQRR